MLNLYKNLLLSLVKSNFLSENPTSKTNNDKFNLDKLLEEGKINLTDKSGYEKIKELLSNITQNELGNLSSKVQKDVEGIITNTSNLKESGISVISDDGNFTTFSRKTGTNSIKINNNDNTITDTKGLLGNLDFTGYNIQEALIEVDDILSAVEEAEIFNTNTIETTKTKLKVAFRLKHAIIVKNDIV